MDELVYDTRHAVRLWAASPGLSMVAILTIALGIGITTAIAGQIKAVFWTPLHVAEPAQLRAFSWSAARYPYVIGGALNALPGPDVGGAATFGSFSFTAFEAMRDAASGFTDIACWGDFGEARPVTLGERGFGAVQFVSGSFFRTLGLRAQLGRLIEPDDDGAETWAPVAVIGHGFWQRAFGRDPAAIRQTLMLNGRRFAIVGVMPESFSGMDPATTADVLVPMGATTIAAQTANPLRNRGIWSVCRVIGRLQAGTSEEQARLGIEHALAESIASQPPPGPYDAPRVFLTEAGYGLGTLRDATSTPLAVLLSGIVALLLAACANIAGLLLARSAARQREIATRLALGAPRPRLIRQLISESLVLSGAGGLAGIGLAFGLSDASRALLSQFVPALFGADRGLQLSTAPDGRVLVIALTGTVVTGLLFGVSPAVRATRLDLITAIRPGRGGGGRRGHTGPVLVGAQAALAIVLIAGTGMFVKTVAGLRSADLGFSADRLLYARVEPRSANLPQDQRAAYFEATVNRIERLPGVAAASAATQLPFGGATNVGSEPTLNACPPGAESGGRTAVPVRVNFIAPGFFRTLGVEHLAGRDLTWSDRPTGPQAPAIVNVALAEQVFGRRDVIGASVRFAEDCSAPAAAPLTFPVIGVVGDIRADDREPAPPTLYWHLGGVGIPATLLVRTHGDPGPMIATVRKAVAEVNAGIPTFSEAPLPALRERAFRRERLLSTLLGLFAIVTLGVAALGIYGLLSYEVATRRGEIGIRMAVGADAGAVVRLVVGDSVRAVAIGASCGLAVSVVIHRALESMLYGVSPGDPSVLGPAIGIFLVVAGAAAAIPARMASRVDPVQSLRD